MIFALFFFVFGGCMLVFFSDVFYLRLFTISLLVFCGCFIFYVARLLRYIQAQYALDTDINAQLTKYIKIISRFTRLYFQITMIMIPLILLMALIAGYLDEDRSGDFIILMYSQTILIYFSLAIVWSVMMYFITKWYIKRLYGDHLSKLKELLLELREVE